MWKQEYPYSLDRPLTDALVTALDNGDNDMALSIQLLIQRYKSKLYAWEDKRDGTIRWARNVPPAEVVAGVR